MCVCVFVRVSIVKYNTITIICNYHVIKAYYVKLQLPYLQEMYSEFPIVEIMIMYRTILCNFKIIELMLYNIIHTINL